MIAFAVALATSLSNISTELGRTAFCLVIQTPLFSCM